MKKTEWHKGEEIYLYHLKVAESGYLYAPTIMTYIITQPINGKLTLGE